MINEWLIYIILIVNVLSFLLFGIDKARAKCGAWRIPEAVLLTSAALFGSAGALAGMLFFHHKTKHLKFTICVPLLLFIQILAVVLLKSSVVI